MSRQKVHGTAVGVLISAHVAVKETRPRRRRGFAEIASHGAAPSGCEGVKYSPVGLGTNINRQNCSPSSVRIFDDTGLDSAL